MAAVSQCCAVCLSECTGAHSCSVCHKIVHVICSEASTSDEDEGYGSTVICKKCSEQSNDEPPIKKTIDWAIKYPPKSETLKHKKPQPKSANKSKTNRLFEQEKRCICLTCFRDGQDPGIYVMSRRDNSTKERHVLRRHAGEARNDVAIVNWECIGDEMEQARDKYSVLQKKEDAGSKQKANMKQKLITTGYKRTQLKESGDQVGHII